MTLLIKERAESGVDLCFSLVGKGRLAQFAPMVLPLPLPGSYYPLSSMILYDSICSYGPSPVAAVTLHQPIYISQFAFTVHPLTWQLLASVGDGYL